MNGPGNDVVKIYVDGVLKKTGTTWENYYRYDPEQAGNGNQVPEIAKMLFRLGGVPAPTNLSNGFLVDGLSLASSTPATTNCNFVFSGGQYMDLRNNCTTDGTILVPNGYELRGYNHTITAIDPPGGHFVGAVVKNGGAVASVTRLKVTTSGLDDVCDAGDDRLRGIMLDGASGRISFNTVTNINQGQSGCQEGNAIEVRNAPFDGTHPGTKTVLVNENTVFDYQKTGIVANGDINVNINHNDLGASFVDPHAHRGEQHPARLRRDRPDPEQRDRRQPVLRACRRHVRHGDPALRRRRPERPSRTTTSTATPTSASTPTARTGRSITTR